MHELASDHAGTLDGQTSGVAHVKEIVKYYAQRRGVLTFAPASSTACQDVPRTQGNQLRALPGYGPDIARNRAEAQQLMRKAGYGPDNPSTSTNNSPATRPSWNVTIRASPSIWDRFGREPVSGSAFHNAVSDWQARKSLSQERDRWFESGSLQR